MARDKGTVPYMDFGTVEVNIGDRNDNEPFFKTVSKMKLGMVKNFVFALVHNPLLTLFLHELGGPTHPMYIPFEGLTFFYLF